MLTNKIISSNITKLQVPYTYHPQIQRHTTKMAKMFNIRQQPRGNEWTVTRYVQLQCTAALLNYHYIQQSTHLLSKLSMLIHNNDNNHYTPKIFCWMLQSSQFTGLDTGPQYAGLQLFYLRQRRRYMFSPVFICLSVSKITQRCVPVFGWNVDVDRCRDMDVLINFWAQSGWQSGSRNRIYTGFLHFSGISEEAIDRFRWNLMGR